MNKLDRPWPSGGDVGLNPRLDGYIQGRL